MTMPDVWAEIAFRKDPLTSAPLWHDVSDDVEWQEGVRVSRRRSHELDEVQPGTLSLTLLNEDGRYTAGKTSSPHYPYVKINRPVRIRARWPVSANMLLEEQAKGNNASLFSATSGAITVEASVVPAGQTTSIRWAAGTVGVGTLFRLGSTATTTATDRALPVTPGVTYSVRCQARRDASVTVSFAIRARYYSNDGTTLLDVTGTGVALTTTFQALSLSTTAPANAAFARVGIVCTGASASPVVVYTGAWQLERAAAPTAWVSPGVEYIRYSGLIDRWPHAWQNGVVGRTDITATDLFKILSRRQTRNEALIQEVLTTGPRFYYPCNEAADADAVGNLAVTSQPDLTPRSMGDGGGSVTLGASGGPLGGTMANFDPVDDNGGTGLATSALLTPMGGTTSATLMAWFVPENPPTDPGALVYVGNGDLGIFLGTMDSVHFYLSYRGGGSVEVRAAQRIGSVVVITQAVTLDLGTLHMAVAVTEWSTGSLRVKIYLDGVLIKDETNPLVESTWDPVLDHLSIGGVAHAYPARVEAFNGRVSHAAGWNRALSAGEITALYAAGSVINEASGQRISTLLTWADQSTALIDPGLSDLDTRLYGADDGPLRAVMQAAASEAGLFFIGRDGIPVFHDRQWRQDPGGAPLITLAAHECGPDLGFLIDDTLLINDVTVTRGSLESRVVDEVSVEEYGQYAKSVPTQLASSFDAISRGSQMLARYAEPSPRAGQITVEGRSLTSLWPSLLGSEIDQRFLVTGLPSNAPAASLSLWCEGVQDVITDQTWRFTFDTSPMDASALVLDDPAFGLLDSNTLGW
ncbi:LamG-like jellyroll fold domain-containing protein [Nonomuraea sp. NPDC002799]